MATNCHIPLYEAIKLKSKEKHALKQYGSKSSSPWVVSLSSNSVRDHQLLSRRNNNFKWTKDLQSIKKVELKQIWKNLKIIWGSLVKSGNFFKTLLGKLATLSSGVRNLLETY